MSEALGADAILSQAKELEKQYDWLEAAEFYKRALDLVPKQDFLSLGEVCERLGYAFHRAAMQVESQEEFKERMQRAIEAYAKAHGFYEKLTDEQKDARMLRCKAITRYHGYWLTSSPSEKRRLLDECLELEGKALAAFSESGDALEYVKTYNELPLVFFNRFHLEWNRQTAEKITEKGLKWGEKAVSLVSELSNPYEIARSFFILATCLGHEWFLIEDIEEQSKTRAKAVKYLSKAAEIFERVGDSFHLGVSHFWWGIFAEDRRNFEISLDCGKLTKDNFLIAGGLDFLAYVTYWEAVGTEDPEKKKELVEKAMQLYDEGQSHYSVISYMTPRYGLIGPPAAYAEHYYHLATWEPDPEKRLEFLEKSEKSGMEALKLAEDSDMPLIIATTLHVLSKTLEFRAHVEQDPTQKRSQLERALKHREKTIQIFEQLTPFDFWDVGVMYNYLANIKAELANIEPTLDDKRRLLEEAVLGKEKCLEFCEKGIAFLERIGDIKVIAAFQGYQDRYATLQTRLYSLTNKPEHLRKAMEILQKAIESAHKLELVSHIAESYWKIAKAQNILEEHLKAAENFEQASQYYTKAAEKIPQLKNFYQDHALYMQAWSELEKARHHHAKQEYGLAKEHFDKAANIHKTLKAWNYLASNYSAWARIEYAEDLSRKEQCEEAIQAFEQATQLFNETKKSLQTELAKIESADEKQMATNLLKASDLRQEYCQARIALEEARILDKKGDHYSSSEKYGLAVETFEKISQALTSEQDKREFKLIVSLSRAWQKMTRAEAESSPTLYLEASQLFEETKEYSPNEQTKTLALAHSRFCKALEAGTKFADTGDTTMHAAAVQYLDSAAKYYVKAGFQKASEYAKATELLFDAYVQMNNAKKEKDPEKKTKLYMMTEKVLQTSAGSFMKAEHPEKREQVLRLLDKVREERELAVSLIEMLHAPSIVSATTAFVTPTPTQEEAVGLEKFENADIQANIILRQKELKVGENLDLEIELVNAGKGPALLIKVMEIIPEGFEITEKPQIYRVEDNYLNMKGKRLDPLKTEEVKLILKPKVQGVFPLRPRVMYLDENGKYKSHQPEPITITVKELGIKGWLKGDK